MSSNRAQRRVETRRVQAPRVQQRRYGTVSFLSDYGHCDEFVGVVHSVIASIAPDARTIDITHGIAPCDVRAGGLALARAAQYLLSGVVLAVVDPGVGGDRRPVAVEVGGGASVLVGPDNGLLAPAVALVGGADRAVKLDNPSYRLARQPELGPTFDGRDVFAPAAAHLCNGVPLEDLGAEIDTASLTPAMLPVSSRDGGDLLAEILWIDRFGNCQLNVDPSELSEFAPADSPLQIVAENDLRVAQPAGSYGDVPAGRVGLITDSSGLVSLAMNRRSTAQELKLSEGSQVRIRVVGDTAGDGTEASRVSTGISTPVNLTHRNPAPTQEGQT